MLAERHKYEYQIEQESDSGPARVIRNVGTDKRVLEIGSGPGSITRPLSEKSNCRVTAVDIDSESLRRLESCCDKTFQLDLNNPAWPDTVGRDSRFEVVVAADVLEHLLAPLLVLKAMKNFLATNGYMVISLPHVAHSAVHACLLDEDFEYGDSGLLDRTHIRFFGIKNIQKLFEDAGLKIVHAEFVVRDPRYTEFAARWARISPEIRAVLAGNRFGMVYQVVVKAVPAEAAGDPMVLMDLPVLARIATRRDSVGAFLRTHLGPGIYAKLRLAAAKLGVAFRG
jgi:2-polyprenyl-3-methyl-5-hydroxy-6-metoxy-1,4-benzoquinol methylase